MPSMYHHGSIMTCVYYALISCATPGHRALAQASVASLPAIILSYPLDEHEDRLVKDQSANHSDGFIVGSYAWQVGAQHGLALDGSSYIRVDSPSLAHLSDDVSFVAWVKGSGSPLRIVEHPDDGPIHNHRTPDFRVCGDTVYLVSNTDRPDPNEGGYENHRIASPALWIGKALANLSSWEDHYTLTDGLEPKLQVTTDGVHYEYFGPDGIGQFQVWTAAADHDLRHFSATQQTTLRPSPTQGAPNQGDNNLYRVEQEGNFEIVDGRAQYAYPERGIDEDWQLWTASANEDGSGFRSVQRTHNGGWIPNLQVFGKDVYYIYAQQKDYPARHLYIARSDLNGDHWRVLATFNDVDSEDGDILVTEKSVLFSYSRLRGDGNDELVTGSAHLDGSHLASTARPVIARHVWVDGIQMIGDRVYFGFTVGAHMIGANGHGETASGLGWSTSGDGSDWHEQVVSVKSRENYDSVFGYGGYEIVGGKTYYSLGQVRPNPSGPEDFRIFLGTSGANLFSRGDSLGIGVTEANEVTAFVNAGEDYTCRGGNPQATVPTAARGTVPADDKWHQLSAVYSHGRVKLYVDGVEAASAQYSIPPVQNEFPFLIGDGFRGTMWNVRIYDGALSEGQVRELNIEERRLLTK